MGLSGMFIIIGVGAGAYRYQWIQNAEPATAMIVELIERESESGVTYAPVFVFRDSAGQEHTVRSSVSSYPPAGEVGENIFVLYPSDKPQFARIDTFFAKWGLATIAGGLGLFYLLIFWLVAILTRRRMERSEPSDVVNSE